MDNIPADLKEESCQLFLQQLRKATQPMHTKLEESRLSVNLMKGDVSKTEYADYLVYMSDVIAYHEFFTYPVVEHLFDDMSARHKLPMINNDIEVLRQQGVTITPNNEYRINTLLPLSIARALGYMYVIEGSTLGGRMILKHIKTALGFDEQNGAHFFAGYGNETGKRWNKFIAIFANYAVIESCQQEIITAATDAFESIQTHFA
jgi:heme oxygenase